MGSKTSSYTATPSPGPLHESQKKSPKEPITSTVTIRLVVKGLALVYITELAKCFEKKLLSISNILVNNFPRIIVISRSYNGDQT